MIQVVMHAHLHDFGIIVISLFININTFINTLIGHNRQVFSISNTDANISGFFRELSADAFIVVDFLFQFCLIHVVARRSGRILIFNLSLQTFHLFNGRKYFSHIIVIFNDNGLLTGSMLSIRHHQEMFFVAFPLIII